MEGEFRDRINIWMPPNKSHESSIDSLLYSVDQKYRESLFNALDEAKKEFPLDPKADWYFMNKEELRKWFLKWFGDQ